MTTGTKWTSSTYPNSCSWSMPTTPFCINDNFKYRGQFNACRQSLLNYKNALYDYADCANRNLASHFNNINQSVISVKKCYDEKYLDNNQSSSCNLVKVPREVELYSVESNTNNIIYRKTLDFGANVPACVRAGSSGPTDKISYETFCLPSIRNYLNPSNNESGQQQLNNYMDWLYEEINERLRVTTDAFNCRANRNSYCTQVFH